MSLQWVSESQILVFVTLSVMGGHSVNPKYNESFELELFLEINIDDLLQMSLRITLLGNVTSVSFCCFFDSIDFKNK